MTRPLDKVAFGPFPELRLRPAPERPVVALDTITVSDETVAVAGTLSEEIGDVTELCINGRPVPVDARGRFFAVVGLAGYDGVSIWVHAGVQGEFNVDVPLRTPPVSA